MPRLDKSDSQTHQVGGGFQFSAIRPEELGASEYTLVTLVVDTTASVEEFRDDLLAAVQAAVGGCRHSPRADHLLLRLLTFNTTRSEIHGFRPVSDIDPAAYAPFQPAGMTALYDAVYDAVLATNRYARLLSAQDFQVNAALYIVTDGADNSSRVGPRHIAEELRGALREEVLASLHTVLVGINTATGSVRQHLERFRVEAGLKEFLPVSEATPERLAALAAYVSRSVNVQSQLLASGATASLPGF